MDRISLQVTIEKNRFVEVPVRNLVCTTTTSHFTIEMDLVTKSLKEEVTLEDSPTILCPMTQGGVLKN